MWRCGSMPLSGVCGVCRAQYTTHTPLEEMLPHHHITYNNIIIPSVLI
jgi:hypothetical protein